MSFEDTKKILKACLDNAHEHLKAAKAAQDAKAFGVAYHLAALALEEIGKSVLVVIAAVSRDDEETVSANRSEDHSKKLFWALWSPVFGKSTPSVLQIQQYENLARTIHNNRLAAIYVDPFTGQLLRINPEEVEELISLAEQRIEMERATSYAELDAQAKEDFSWFQSAINDEVLKKYFVFTKVAVDKLTELRGDSKRWIRWIREKVESWQEQSADVLRQELARKQPDEIESKTRKWIIRIKLFADSHSLRPGPLNTWNQKVNDVKLTKGEKDVLFAELSLSKGFHVSTLWPVGLQLVGMFVVSLNVGTFGFFWWFLPTHVSRYFEYITDLETQGRVTLDRTPILKLEWGRRHALTEPDLNRCAMVFSYIAQFSQEQGEAVNHYMRGLAMIAKTDIFLQMQPGAVRAFYDTLRTLLRHSGDWDGVEPFTSAAERVLGPVFTESTDMRRVFD